MWNLQPPDISTARTDLDLVFPDTMSPAVATKADKDHLAVLYREYEAAQGRPQNSWLEGGLSESVRSAILDAYGEVKEGGKLADLRSAIKLSVDQCPYCGFGEIRDLDHHLQKAHFKCFSIFALNLIPTCSKCNGHKPRKPRDDPEKHHLHAYLEDLSNYKFLFADISIDSESMTTNFRISKSEGMSEQLFKRLQHHLEDFHLNERYPAQVNIFLSEQRASLDFAHEIGGGAAVKNLLKRGIITNEKSFGINDWRVALLTALAENQEFCDGGFTKILGSASAETKEATETPDTL